MKKTVVSIALLSILGVAAIAHAKDEGPHDAAIKGRQAIYQVYGYSLAVLAAMAKGETEYNAEIAAQSANNLFAAAGFGQAGMWPPGSDNATEGNAETRALPAIWQNFPDVAEKSKALLVSSEKLAAEAGNGLEALRGAMGDVGASCKGCHDDYRAKRR